MRRVNTSRLPRAQLLTIAAAALLISGCGGGGGGGAGFTGFPMSNTPEQVQASPAVADSSAPCFNEADFREGTFVEFEAVKPGATAATLPSRRKSVTEGREAFGGANPIAFNVGSEKSSGPQFRRSSDKKEYKDSVGGNILMYGISTTEKFVTELPPGTSAPAGFNAEQVAYSAQVYSPPLSFPVDMTPGQVVSKQTSLTKIQTFNGRGDPAISVPAKGELTYHGREKLETALGTTESCKFSLTISAGSSVTKTSTKEFWLAADGPYRGQLLKGGDAKSQFLVTKMTYSPK